jgi:hypothetical protein
MPLGKRREECHGKPLSRLSILGGNVHCASSLVVAPSYRNYVVRFAILSKIFPKTMQVRTDFASFPGDTHVTRLRIINIHKYRAVPRETCQRSLTWRSRRYVIHACSSRAHDVENIATQLYMARCVKVASNACEETKQKVTLTGDEVQGDKTMSKSLSVLMRDLFIVLSLKIYLLSVRFIAGVRDIHISPKSSCNLF